MLRLSVGSLMIASALALAGCEAGTVPSTSEVAESGDPLLIERIDPALLGTFRGDAIAIGELTLLALKSDNTFHYGMAIACVVGTPCGPAAEDGVYRIYKQKRDKQVLELYGEKNTLRGRFEMELTGETLRLRRLDTGGGEWRTMSRSEPAWCAEKADCGMQNLKEGACVGDWDCALDACAYRCSATSCEAQGGRCQTAGGCSQEAVGDATEYACKSAGLECCVKLAEQPACLFEGTANEGWYLEKGQALICNAKCAGASVRCSGVSATSEGYYAIQGEGCDGALVLRGRCSL